MNHDKFASAPDWQGSIGHSLACCGIVSVSFLFHFTCAGRTDRSSVGTSVKSDDKLGDTFRSTEFT